MKIELDYRKSTIGGACKDTHLAEFGFGVVLHSTVHSDLNTVNSFIFTHQAMSGDRRRHSVLRTCHAEGLFARAFHRRAGRDALEGMRGRRREGCDPVRLRDADRRGQDGVEVQVLGSLSRHNGEDSPKISSSGIFNFPCES